LAQKRLDQANLAYQEAVRGFTAEEHKIAEANVEKAAAKIETIRALVDQMTVTAPVASQVYQIPAEEGEVVTPRVPLLSLVDLNDTWLGFSLREDLIAGLKVGDRFAARIPALGDREVLVEVRVIAAKANTPAGGRHGPPATSICGLLRSAGIRSTRSTDCDRA
jgi:HlyD family secretion protein